MMTVDETAFAALRTNPGFAIFPARMALVKVHQAFVFQGEADTFTRDNRGIRQFWHKQCAWQLVLELRLDLNDRTRADWRENMRQIVCGALFFVLKRH